MAAGSTYTPIATHTLSSSAMEYTFSSIPQTYTDLVIVANIPGTTNTGAGLMVRFNGNTGTNYSAIYLYGNGSSAATHNATNDNRMLVGVPQGNQTVPITNIVNIMNYYNTTTFKSVVSRGNQVGSTVDANVGMWRSTAAITSITYGFYGTITMNSGTTLTLYGITAA